MIVTGTSLIFGGYIPVIRFLAIVLVLFEAAKNTLIQQGDPSTG